MKKLFKIIMMAAVITTIMCACSNNKEEKPEVIPEYAYEWVFENGDILDIKYDGKADFEYADKEKTDNSVFSDITEYQADENIITFTKEEGNPLKLEYHIDGNTLYIRRYSSTLIPLKTIIEKGDIPSGYILKKIEE